MKGPRNYINHVNWKQLLSEDLSVKECWKWIEGKIKEGKETFVPSERFSARNSGQKKKKKKKKK